MQLTREPEIDLEALKKAMFIEYIYHESDEYDVWPWAHQVDFDLDGNVWLAYTACCIVKFDPRTGEQTAFEGHGKHAGYGGNITVLYTDKDNIATLGAYHSETSAGYQLSGYSGPPSPTGRRSIAVTGRISCPVPHRKASSAKYSSLRSMTRTWAGSPVSSR